VFLTEQQLAFLAKAQGAGMITLRADGTACAVRVGIALVDGQVWSSGTRKRKRTAHLRRDPRSTLFVYEAGYGFLTIESRVTILDGPDAALLSLRLFRTMQKRPTGPLQWFGTEKAEPEFIDLMVSDERLIYQFEPLRAYGLL
jgi:hypothetical protein